MYILLAGLNHKTAPLQIREKLTFSSSGLNEAYNFFRENEHISGAVILNTCNRTELYATCRDKEQGQKVLKDYISQYMQMDQTETDRYLYVFDCYDTVSHLFQVCSGIDSMVLGESQILAQVKEAYINALDIGATDTVLNTLFQRALYVGKKVRFNTGIDQHSLSIGLAAVELAEKIWGNLLNKKVLIIGAGEMAELCTRSLKDRGVNSIIVSNRSYQKAQEMASQFAAQVIRLDEIEKELLQADIVISCTSAHHLIIKADLYEQVLRSRAGRKLMLVDIAVPRDIDPALQEIPGIYLYDIDDLQNVVADHYNERVKAAAQGKRIISAELQEFYEWLESLYVVPIISALKAHGENIKNKELKKAFNRLGDISEYEQGVIVQMAHNIVNQLLHAPVVNLRNNASGKQGHVYAELTRKLFDLEVMERKQGKYEVIKNRNQGKPAGSVAN